MFLSREEIGFYRSEILHHFAAGAPDRYDNVIYDLYLTSFIVYQFTITTERAKYTELAVCVAVYKLLRPGPV